MADSSSYVRKTACACMVKVYTVDSDQFVGLRDMTLKLLNDRNISVVASALVTFHFLCIAKRPPVGIC